MVHPSRTRRTGPRLQSVLTDLLWPINHELAAPINRIVLYIGVLLAMDYHSRNTVWGFRDRVRKNLMFLNSARNRGADIHVVTELITSLLGLIVFPYEEIKRARYASFKKYKLKDLYNKGWPNWVFDIGSSEDLHNLVYHLRNSISHRRIQFSSDSRNLEAVDVQFRDRKNDNAPDDWGVTINAAELQQFVLRFADLLKEWERDYS